MESRFWIMIIGVIGAVVFLAVGLTSFLPWVFAEPVAATFVTGFVLSELSEYLKGRTTPSGQKESGTKPGKKQARTVSLQNSPIEVVTMGPKASRRYQAQLRKGELLTVEAGAD